MFSALTGILGTITYPGLRRSLNIGRTGCLGLSFLVLMCVCATLGVLFLDEGDKANLTSQQPYARWQTVLRVESG